MSFPEAGQCARGSRDRWLGCHHFVLLLEGDKHCFGSTVVVRKGGKASVQGTGGLSLEQCAVLDWVSPQLLCGVAPGSHGSVGQQCHSALPKSLFCCFPVVLRMQQLSSGRESLGGHLCVPCLIPGVAPTGNILHQNRDLP